MLQYIKIKNLALLYGVTLELDAGFTAVTGETGAGKSVLLGALSLLAGARTDKTMIRQGSDEIEVEAALYLKMPQRLMRNWCSRLAALRGRGISAAAQYSHRTKMRKW